MVEEIIDIDDDLSISQMQKLAKEAERASKELDRLQQKLDRKGGAFGGKAAGKTLPKNLGLTGSQSPIVFSESDLTKDDIKFEKLIDRITKRIKKDQVKQFGKNSEEGRFGFLGELFGGSDGAKNILSFGKNPANFIEGIAKTIPWLGGVFAAKEIAEFIVDEIAKIDRFYKEFIDRIDTRERPDRTRESRARIAAGLEQEIITTHAGSVDPRDAYNTYEQFNNNQNKLEVDFQLRDTSGA